MPRLVGRASRVLVICVMVVVANAPARSTASATPRLPAYVRSARLHITSGTPYKVRCEPHDQDLQGFFMGAAQSESHVWGVANYPLAGPLAQIALRGLHLTEGDSLNGRDSRAFGFGGAATGPPGATVEVKVAWAVWGDAVDCAFSVGGVHAPYRNEPAVTAAHLFAADFDRGVGLHAGAGAAVAQSYERTARGSLWAWLLGGTGVATIDDPHGQRYVGTGVADHPVSAGIDLAVYGDDAAGTWTYSILAGAGLWGPQLWILEVEF